MIGKSPAHYRDALLHPSPDTDARKRGRATHVAVYEPELYGSQYVVWDGRRAGKEWEAFRSEHESKGREILVEKMHETAQTIAKAVRGCAAAFPYLRGGKKEMTLLWEMDGHQCKGRTDYIIPGKAIVDLKTTRDSSLFGFPREVLRYGYHGQAAWYVDAYKAITGQALPYVFIAVESVAPYVVTVFRLPDDVLSLGRELYQSHLRRLEDCIATDTWDGYAGAEVTLALPEWSGADVATDADPTGLGIEIGVEE